MYLGILVIKALEHNLCLGRDKMTETNIQLSPKLHNKRQPIPCMLILTKFEVLCLLIANIPPYEHKYEIKHTL